MGAVALFLVAALLAPSLALAHAVPSPSAAHAAVEPWLAWMLLASAAGYAAGTARLWSHAGLCRGISLGQAAAFGAGWLTLVAALATPLDALAARLFCAHMVQHELLMIVAAPLLVLGRPLAAWTWAFAPRQRHLLGDASRWRWFARPWSGLTQPIAAWALHALALWVWHVPRLFDAALASEGLHVLQHASFLGTALLFWWAVLGGDSRSSRGSAGLVSLFTTMLHTGALGALLTFSASTWYPAYRGAYGLTPVEDQQLGGLVMWIPGGAAYLVAGLVLVARLLARPAVTPATAARPVPTR